MKSIIFLIFLLISFLVPENLKAQIHSRPDIYSFNPTERCELRDLMVNYLNIGGGIIALDHQSPPGPLTFQDIHCYDDFFLTWHREYIRGLEEWLLSQNGGSKYVPLPEWDPSTSIPCEFFNSSCPTCPGSAIATSFSNLNNQNPSGYDFSRFLSTSTLCSYTSGNRTPPQFGKPSRFGSAIDNLAWDLQREHNNPHVSIGGVMGSGASPAAAIFWLWHGYIDDIYRLYQCECQGDVAKDLCIADSNMDIGNEPDVETTSPIYQSPEIWVRNIQDVIGGDGRYTQQDNPLRHQNPEAGQTNYIYVRVRNIGCEPILANEVDLKVYYSKASTGLHWPTHWNNYQVAGITYGDEIPNPVPMPLINPGEQYVAEIPWNPPNPSIFGETQSHVCLLGRLESVVDPMAFVETTSVGANTRNNNNVAWKNVEIVDINPFVTTAVNFREFVFEVIQPEGVFDPIRLDFKKVGDFSLDRVILKASSEVMDTFLLKGEPIGMEMEDDPLTGEVAFLIVGDDASIENLFLAPGQTVPIKIRFELECSEQGGFPCANFGDVYRYDVEQFTQGVFGDGFVGGVSYELRIKHSQKIDCEPIIKNADVNNPICENNPSGFIGIELDGKEPYRIYWNNGNSSKENSNLLPGDYNVTVVDNNNCIDTMSFQLIDKSDLEIDSEVTSPYCATPNGSIKVSVSGGSPPYTYEWSNGSGESTIKELGIGTYFLSVTDSENCLKTKTFTLGMTMFLGGDSYSTDATSSNSADGSAYIIPTGGTPPYSYNWNNGVVTDSIINLLPGDYVVTLTDSKGCTFVDSVFVDFVNSIDDLKSDNDFFELSPNPTNNIILIKLKNWNVKSVDITVMDESGKGVIRNTNKSVHDKVIEIDVKNLPSGIYYLTLHDQKKSVTQKFIKID